MPDDWFKYPSLYETYTVLTSECSLFLYTNIFLVQRSKSNWPPAAAMPVRVKPPRPEPHPTPAKSRCVCKRSKADRREFQSPPPLPYTGNNYKVAIHAGLSLKPTTPHWYLRQWWRPLWNHRLNMTCIDVNNKPSAHRQTPSNSFVNKISSPSTYTNTGGYTYLPTYLLHGVESSLRN